MRDIPLFTTEFGVASLTLSQIPYTQRAYVRIQVSENPKLFLDECVDFCKAAGADSIYATGHSFLDKFPPHTAIWLMTCEKDSLIESEACLFPVQETTAEKWREIYNERMRYVPNAAYMTQKTMNELVHAGSAYFVHKEGCLLGIGAASGNKIDAIAAVQSGAGYDVLCAMSGALSDSIVQVEVASENLPALRLYERAGFIKVQEISKWYKII